jgi:NADPH2:quinone reductase
MMKAIVINELGGPDVMRVSEISNPQPKANEALIKIAYSGVNFIDVYFREGRYKAQLPFILGQEASGTVAAAGGDVRSVKVGDRVAQTTVMGSYAELQAVPAEKLVKIPEGVSEMPPPSCCKE